MRYLKLALKNTAREKKRSFLLAGAIAFGLSVILLVSALGDGLLDSFLNQQAGMISGHIVMRGFSLNERDRMVSRIDKNDSAAALGREFFTDLERINFRTTAQGTLINGSEAMQQMIIGIDPREETAMEKLLIMESGRYLTEEDEQGVLVSADLAEQLMINPGDRILLKTRTQQGMQNVTEVEVTGIISGDLGMMSDLAVFAQRTYLNTLLNIPEESSTEVHFFLTDPEGSEQRATDFWTFLQGRGVPLVDRPEDRSERQEIVAHLSQQEWEGTRYYLSSLEEDIPFVFVMSSFLNGTAMIVMIILLGIILVGVGNTLRMVIYERRKEIGTLRALGMKRSPLLFTLLTEMLLITLLGALAGIGIAQVAGAAIRSITFDGGHSFLDLFLYRNHMSLLFAPSRILSTVLTITVLVGIASYLPARKAAKLDPAKAIHSIA
ncbi:MAG: ABC transporter permease [Spirochaetales bacterium]|nr:ABC transporter permease [Spirochaetales bacterium]